MHVTLCQLRYFVVIAQSRSFSQAAGHLLIAQSALSQNIATLEAEMGIRFFIRHARGVKLSPAGERLFAEAADLLARDVRIPVIVTADSGNRDRSVAVGSFLSIPAS